jgi:hypothetical protein
VVPQPFGGAGSAIISGSAPVLSFRGNDRERRSQARSPVTRNRVSEQRDGNRWLSHGIAHFIGHDSSQLRRFQHRMVRGPT